MSNKKCQHEVTALDGTKLVAESVPDGTENVCAGCYFEGEPCLELRISNPSFECDPTAHGNKNGIIWIEKEQPVSKPDTIKELRAKTVTLQNEIYKLIKAFEADTGIVVHGVDISRHYQIGGKSVLSRPELDVRLN